MRSQPCKGIPVYSAEKSPGNDPVVGMKLICPKSGERVSLAGAE